MMMCPPMGDGVAAAHQRPGCLKAGVEFFLLFFFLYQYVSEAGMSAKAPV